MHRQLGLQCNTLDLEAVSQKGKSLSDFDVVVDFTYPTGNSAEALARIQLHIDRLGENVSNGAKVVFMSSLMAFGMPLNSQQLANYYYPRTTYAAIKRTSERILAKAAIKHHFVPYAIRLGEVHGWLQAVSAGMRQHMAARQIVARNKPTDLSICVFASSVAAAICRIAEDKVDPGMVSLVSSPQWSLQELYQFYQQEATIPCDVRFMGRSSEMNKYPVLNSLMAFSSRYRQFIEVAVLMRSRTLSTLAKGLYRRSGVSAIPAGCLPNAIVKEHVFGSVPGRTIPDIRSSMNDVVQDGQVCKEMISNMLRIP